VRAMLANGWHDAAIAALEKQIRND